MSNSEALEAEVADLKEKLEALKDKFDDFIKDHCVHHKLRRHIDGRCYCVYCGIPEK